MAYEKAGWATITAPSGDLHILPSHDVIEHKNRFHCVCNPTVEVYKDLTGKIYWVTTHNAFDEFLDDSQTEPYKGL